MSAVEEAHDCIELNEPSSDDIATSTKEKYNTIDVISAGATPKRVERRYLSGWRLHTIRFKKEIGLSLHISWLTLLRRLALFSSFMGHDASSYLIQNRVSDNLRNSPTNRLPCLPRNRWLGYLRNDHGHQPRNGAF